MRKVVLNCRKWHSELDRPLSISHYLCPFFLEKGRYAMAINAKAASKTTFQVSINGVNKTIEVKMDILINNAGITRGKTLLKMSHSEWQQLIDINLTGVFNCTKAVVSHMYQRKYGSIICAPSINGVHSPFGQTNYAVAKIGLIGMCRSWAKELGKFNIKANAVAPGFIATDMTNEIPEEMRNAAIAQIPIKRMGLPIDIANAYLFLASEEASFISGQGVNGGVALLIIRLT